jgi:hypothetical protein
MRDFIITFFLKEEAQANITSSSIDPIAYHPNDLFLKISSRVGPSVREKFILTLSNGKELDVKYDKLFGKYSCEIPGEYNQLGKIDPQLLKFVENVLVTTSVRPEVELPVGFIDSEFYSLTTSKDELPGLIGEFLGTIVGEVFGKRQANNDSGTRKEDMGILYKVELFVKNTEWYLEKGEAFIKNYILYRG